MASQTVDDMIASLLSMGFEFQDAQDAIQYGKISTQEAVEWLLAGKPGFAGSGQGPPTLKLNDNQNRALPSLRPDRQAPFSRPLPLPDALSASSPPHSAPESSIRPATEASTSDTDMEEQVVSRLHLSDTKLADKKSFEQKVRAEAEKKAKLEKLQAKREHERVLKEIAEDRKINKMMRLHGPSASAPSSSTSTTAASQSTAPSQPSSSHHRDGTHCSIQIRLPNGKQLRKKLTCSTTLGQLWQDVMDEAEDQAEGYCGFMQPFPRREFSAAEMNKTLGQLGLVPSGSLVLRKADSTAAPSHPDTASSQSPVEHGPDPETSSAEERRHPYGEWQAVVPENRHNWGRGRTLEGPDPVGDGDDAAGDDDEGAMGGDGQGEVVEEERQHRWGRGRPLEGPAAVPGEEAVDDDNENDDDDDDDDDEDDDWVGQNGFGFLGGAGRGGRGWRGGPGGGMFAMEPGVFMGVGQRLVPLDAARGGNQNNRPIGDLAAEAAQQRLAQPALGVPAVSSEPSIPLYQVRPLQETVMSLVVDRIGDPVCPLVTLGRLPPDLSEKIISHLLQQKLLDPKTLRLFLSCYLQKLILDTYTYATNELLNAVRLHVSLQILSLHSCPLVNDSGIKHIANLKNLKILNLSLCKQITDRSLKVITGFQHLHTLSLEETGVTDVGLVEYLATKPVLKNLNLSRTAVTSSIFPCLANLEQLQVLYLEDTKISSLEGMEQMVHLTALNVASTSISTTTLSHLVSHPTLAQLNIANTDNIVGDSALEYLTGLKLRALCLPDRHTVTSAGLCHIAGMALHTLDLTNYIHVGDDGMEHVGQIISLKNLMLSNTKVTDEGLLKLSDLERLRVLYLDRTAVSDAGISVIRAFKHLSELSLSTTQVTNRFLKDEVLHCCQELTRLNLSRTNIGDKGVVKLKLPYLVLLNLDCTRVHAKVVDTIKANCPALKSVTTANLTPVFEEVEEEEEEDEGI